MLQASAQISEVLFNNITFYLADYLFPPDEHFKVLTKVQKVLCFELFTRF